MTKRSADYLDAKVAKLRIEAESKAISKQQAVVKLAEAKAVRRVAIATRIANNSRRNDG